jgi:alpha-glucoside transport system permease protein
MANYKAAENPRSAGARLVAWLARLLLAVSIPLIAFAALYAGFIFLRDQGTIAPRWIIALFAIVWGVGGVAALYWIFNGIVERMPDAWTARLQPFVFVGPAMFILFAYLFFPAIYTFWLSLLDRDGNTFVGIQNYVELFTGRLLQESIRNNIMWIVFGSTTSGAMGLLMAVWAYRRMFERT